MEVKVYTVATAHLNYKAKGKQKKEQEKILQTIKGSEGFIGVYPYEKRGVLWLFDSLNNAKRCRNLLKSKNIGPLGDNIGEVYVDEKYLGGGN